MTIEGRNFVLIPRRFGRGRIGLQIAELLGPVRSRTPKVRVRKWFGDERRFAPRASVIAATKVVGEPPPGDPRLADVREWLRADAEKFSEETT